MAVWHRSINALKRACFGAAMSAAFTAIAAADPVHLVEIDRTIAGGPVRGWVAVVDLTDPRISIRVTDPLADDGPGDAVLTRTDVWRQEIGATLAINANFFASLGGGRADIIGLSVSNGQVVSPVRVFGGRADPAFMIDADGKAHAGYIDVLQAAGARYAVAGVGGSNSDSIPGTLLVSGGVNTGPSARVQPQQRHPRTAIGTDQTGETMILAVIDGRRPGWSQGVTLHELASIMMEFGAWNAVNLDGGGSSSFVYDDGDQRIENRPSDGAHRAVANHLGVVVAPEQAEPEQARRPIRGVWMRPPATLQTLESQLQTLAGAGIRDLFLETFYWGLATNRSEVFQNRFSFDYLEAAIRIAAKYDIRVHAWLETGYWSFNGSANYILNQHPEWKVVDHLGNTDIGDIPGQVFVNLGHPGVQAMLAEYVAELADYPGLWGIHIDYHRFPLDNNPGDGQPAPYSYDQWSRSEFESIYGHDPLVAAAGPGGPLWNEWVQFRRDSISEAVRVMRDAIEAVNPTIEYSAAVFAQAMTSSSQLVKMQDWPTWAAESYCRTIIPMAYGTSIASIRNDIRTTVQQASGARVVAGLAVLQNMQRPSISQQLSVAYEEGVTDFIIFDAPTLLSNATMRNQLRTFIEQNGPFLPGDFNRDGAIDARDWRFFFQMYQGEPVPVNAFNEPADLNEDGVIDEQDKAIFFEMFRRYRFNKDGVAGERELQALKNSWTGPGPGFPAQGIIGLYDLDGDGDVDYDDQLRLHRLLTEPVPFDFDVNRDGLVDIEDLYEQFQNPVDVNRDGVIDEADAHALEAHLREGELEDMSYGRE